MLDKNRILLSLLLIRIGLGAFFIILSLEKIFSPHTAIERIFHIYGVNFGSSSMILVGAFELVLSLFFILGAYKNLTYFLLIIIETVSVIAWIYHAHDLLSSYSLVTSIPILFSLIALFLCRNFDTKFSLGKRKTIFS